MRLFLLFLALSLSAPLGAEPVRVLASIAPVAWLVEQVGGDSVAVTSLLPPGADPHHYAPTPRRIRQLTEADLLVWGGAPYEAGWRQRVSALPDKPKQLFLPEASTDHDHHDHHGEDPHRWTSPVELREMAAQIRDQLIVLRPQATTKLRQRALAVDQQLAKLQREIGRVLDRSPQRYFLVFHPAWGHFAQAFGLTQLAIEHEGKGPSARALAGRIDQARQLGIKLVVVQPQYDRRAAEVVARALGADIVEADPLSADMPKTLLQLARAIAGVKPDE